MRDFIRPRLYFENGAQEQELNTIVELLQELGPTQALAALLPQSKDKSEGSTEIDENKDGKTIAYKGRKSLTSLEEALVFFEVDLDIWEIERHVLNSWDVHSVENGLQTNYQVKIWLKKKTADPQDIKADLLSQIEPIKPTIKAPAIHKKRKYAVELMITDLHLGKIGFDVNTMEFNWTVQECQKAYEDCIAYTLSKVDPKEIDHFILPTGNDFYNINSDDNSTKAGTPQMTGQFFQNLFKYGRLMVESTIQGLYEIAPVHAYFVPGNHDRDAVFSLGDSIEGRFANIDDVIVENQAIKRMYHQWGKELLIGFDHGDRIREKNWSQVMMVDRPQQYAEAARRYMRFGHYHKNQKKKILDYTIKDEHYGVDVEICPSLSPTDKWHYQNLYVGNIRRSKSFIHERGKGLVQEIYYNL